ncbi:hypothetical protein BJ170DRAFT_223921 [Xylariales sp. AK1849]|nr:hypothetical protein BJ170DRAFT_223921 [Xylariales sp. AK1849]
MQWLLPTHPSFSITSVTNRTHFSELSPFNTNILSFAIHKYLWCPLLFSLSWRTITYHTTPVSHRGGNPVTFAMASQHILATPPSRDATLKSLLEDVHAYNARLHECNLDAEMPRLLNPPGEPLACREPPAVFEAVNAHFSA